MNENLRNRPGPVVWAAIIATTLALLPVFQNTLWLVVPALLALLLYYTLYPLVQALIYRGLRRDHASTLVLLGFMALLAAVAALTAPQAASHAIDWQASAVRYVDGGIRLLDTALNALEAAFPALARAHLADAVTQRLEHSGDIVEQLQPVVVGIVVGTPSLLLAPFLAYFFLRDGRRFKDLLCSAVPNAFFERTLGCCTRWTAPPAPTSRACSSSPSSTP